MKRALVGFALLVTSGCGATLPTRMPIVPVDAASATGCTERREVELLEEDDLLDRHPHLALARTYE